MRWDSGSFMTRQPGQRHGPAKERHGASDSGPLGFRFNRDDSKHCDSCSVRILPMSKRARQKTDVIDWAHTHESRTWLSLT